MTGRGGRLFIPAPRFLLPDSRREMNMSIVIAIIGAFLIFACAVGGVRNHYFPAPGYPAGTNDPHFFPGDMACLESGCAPDIGRAPERAFIEHLRTAFPNSAPGFMGLHADHGFRAPVSGGRRPYRKTRKASPQIFITAEQLSSRWDWAMCGRSRLSGDC